MISAGLNTQSRDPVADRIGVMPNLRANKTGLGLIQRAVKELGAKI